MFRIAPYPRHYALLALTSLYALTALSSLAAAQSQKQTSIIDKKAIELTSTIENMADQSPVVLTGIVGDVRADEFNLYYASNAAIIIELDRFNWSDKATDILSQGETVTIKGFIDDDLFEGREIEAYDLHVHERSTYYRTD